MIAFCGCHVDLAFHGHLRPWRPWIMVSTTHHQVDHEERLLRGSRSPFEHDGIHLASLTEKKRLWWRNAFINTVFIASWYVLSYYVDKADAIFIGFSLLCSYRSITSGCFPRNISDFPHPCSLQQCTCSYNFSWLQRFGMHTPKPSVLHIILRLEITRMSLLFPFQADVSCPLMKEKGCSNGRGHWPRYWFIEFITQDDYTILLQ